MNSEFKVEFKNWIRELQPELQSESKIELTARTNDVLQSRHVLLDDVHHILMVIRP